MKHRLYTCVFHLVMPNAGLDIVIDTMPVTVLCTLCKIAGTTKYMFLGTVPIQNMATMVGVMTVTTGINTAINATMMTTIEVAMIEEIMTMEMVTVMDMAKISTN